MSPHHVILGTAGHIDHGKSSLVRALTGIDPDRLPEERQRGITIDIGFANLKLDDVLVGIVDVPGHERFIRNMVAGAAGVDLALLVIAADDSVMPQTREHLAILEFLRLRYGLVALTKCDRVEASWRDLVVDDIREFLKGTFLEGSPIIKTSVTPDGRASGIDELKSALADICRRIRPASDEPIFRLPVDRSFSVQGVGTVVTGTVWEGSARIGATVELLPTAKTLHVRGLQNHSVAVELVSQGQRAAVNLAGVHHSGIARGDELATPGYLQPSKILTVELSVLSDSSRPIKHRSRQRLHIGTLEVMCVVALLDDTAIRPGCSGLAQLFLARPSTCTCGQPFIIRDEPESTTLGGGRVLQPTASRLTRRQGDRIVRLELLRSDREIDRATTALYFFGARGWTDLDLCRDANLLPSRVSSVLKELRGAGTLVELHTRSRQPARLQRDVLADIGKRVEALVIQLHRADPLVPLVPRERLIGNLVELGDRWFVDAVVQHLLNSGLLIGDDNGVGHPDFHVELSPTQLRLYEELVGEVRESGFMPPDPAKQASLHGVSQEEVQAMLTLGVARRALVLIGSEIYLAAEVEADLRGRVSEALRGIAGLTVSQIRDLCGTSRKFAVPFCNYLDRIGLTRRVGDLHTAK